MNNLSPAPFFKYCFIELRVKLSFWFSFIENYILWWLFSNPCEKNAKVTMGENLPQVGFFWLPAWYISVSPGLWGFEVCSLKGGEQQCTSWLLICPVTPWKTNITIGKQPWMKMYLLIKMVIFQPSMLVFRGGVVVKQWNQAFVWNGKRWQICTALNFFRFL